MQNILIFCAAFLLSYALTWAIRWIAFRLDIIDAPDKGRKLHSQSTPLLGGVAIFLTFWIVMYLYSEKILAGNLDIGHWLGFFAGSCWLIVGGVLDDKYDLKPGFQLIFPVLAILSVIAGGVGIEKITSPWGGYLFFDQWKLPLFYFNGTMHYFWIISDSFVAFWLLGMMYTTKLLDGLDGLVSGMSGIGSLIIFLFTITTRYYQPDIAFAALILAAASFGFLIMNWNPARIFLGEGGSLFLGYALGVLSIISGGKIAIALLIMGIPILDVVWTIIRRLKSGRNPFRFSDRQHLHFLLHDSGMGVKKTVLLYYFFAAAFGVSALFLQSRGKLYAIGILGMIMIAVIAWFNMQDRKKSIHKGIGNKQQDIL